MCRIAYSTTLFATVFLLLCAPPGLIAAEEDLGNDPMCVPSDNQEGIICTLPFEFEIGHGTTQTIRIPQTQQTGHHIQNLLSVGVALNAELNPSFEFTNLSEENDAHPWMIAEGNISQALGIDECTNLLCTHVITFEANTEDEAGNITVPPCVGDPPEDPDICHIEIDFEIPVDTTISINSEHPELLNAFEGDSWIPMSFDTTGSMSMTAGLAEGSGWLKDLHLRGEVVVNYTYAVDH